MITNEQRLNLEARIADLEQANATHMAIAQRRGMFIGEQDERIFELTRVIASERADRRSNDAFLAKRLCRVATLAGVKMPEMTYEQTAECAGTILGQIARAMEEK